MVTEALFSILKDNYNLFKILDALRDVFLLVIIFSSFGSLVFNFFKHKKIDKLYFFELIIVVLLILIITTFLKNLFPALRPLSYFSPYEEQLLDSFPSHHTSLAFGIAFITLVSNLQLGIFLLIIAIWVALLSWLSLMHWPLDIFFGLLIALVANYFTLIFIKTFLRFYAKKIKT